MKSGSFGAGFDVSKKIFENVTAQQWLLFRNGFGDAMRPDITFISTQSLLSDPELPPTLRDTMMVRLKQKAGTAAASG